MPGSKFDPVLTLQDGRILPSGALLLEPDEEFVRIDAWVIQANADGTGAACFGFQDAGGVDLGKKTWTAKANAIHQGQFRPGQALAMAVSVAEVIEVGELAVGARPSLYTQIADPVRGTTRVYQWQESVIIAAPAD